jgi:two-component system sensor histidine kinase KdpD
MHKRQLNLSQQRKDFSKTGKGLLTAACMAAAAASTGFLASRILSRKAACPCAKKASQEQKPEKVDANLLRAISHDLRTPLSGIMGNSLLYLENHDSLSEEEKLNLVGNIHEDSGWLINIVENLLAVTRIRDIDGTLGTREEIVEEVLGETLHKMELRHPGFEIRASIPDEIIMLPMDALLIEQVIINLLENALLHSDSREPVDVIVEDGKGLVTFTIRDYGQGIPKEILDCLSDAAPTMAAAPDSHQKTCIGLAICKAIVSAHHGSFMGRNHSHGAEFVFTLPKRSC